MLNSVKPSARLARRAEKRTALALETLDSSAAAVRAGSSFFGVHEMAMLEVALAPVGREKIAYARAAAGNGFLEHFPRHPKQFLYFGNGEAACPGIRMEPGAKQDFIGVDVPDACNDLLVHEQRFESARTSLHDTEKLILGHRQRVASEPAGEVFLKALLIK